MNGFASLIKKEAEIAESEIITIFFLKSAPPPKSAPPLFFLMFHFSEEIWTEILSKIMK